MKTAAAVLLAAAACCVHAQPIQPTPTPTIWRCGGAVASYSTTPCAAGRAIEVDAPRPAADVAAAFARASAEQQRHAAAIAEQRRRDAAVVERRAPVRHAVPPRSGVAAATSNDRRTPAKRFRAEPVPERRALALPGADAGISRAAQRGSRRGRG